jgi:pilus assembly protein Flp/PilA
MVDFLRRALSLELQRGQRGASAVEYALLITGVAALIVVVVYALGDNVLDMFTATCDSVNQADPGCTTD